MTTLRATLSHHPSMDPNLNMTNERRGANGQVTDEPSQNLDWKPNHRELTIMATLSCLSLMVSLDASIIVTSLEDIRTDLNIDSSKGFWVGTAYLLANAVSMPSITVISHVFGRPICLWLSLSYFTIGSVIGCVAQDLASLLVGRVFQGVGGGGIIILSLVIFTDIVPLRYRPKWYGTVCVGPLAGGEIVQNSTWRWVFYIMFPFCGLGLLLIPFTVSLRPPSTTLMEKLKKIDWLGNLLFALSSTLFLVAISWGGVQYRWDGLETLMPLCAGTIGLALTSLYESFVAAAPFLHLDLFRSPSSVFAYICGMLQGLIIYGQLYYIPFYFQTVKGYSPINTGLALLPVMVTLVPASIVTGALVTRTNDYTWPIRLGWSLTSVGSGLTILWGNDTPASLWVSTLVIMGLGHGSVLNAQNFAAQATSRTGEEGLAAGMYGFLRQFGMALGVAIGTATFQNTRDHGGTLDSTANGALEARQIADISGFHGVFIVFTAISGLAFVMSLCIKGVELDREVQTDHQIGIQRPLYLDQAVPVVG